MYPRGEDEGTINQSEPASLTNHPDTSDGGIRRRKRSRGSMDSDSYPFIDKRNNRISFSLHINNKMIDGQNGKLCKMCDSLPINYCSVQSCTASLCFV